MSRKIANAIAAEIQRAARRPLKSQYLPDGWTPPDLAGKQLSYDDGESGNSEPRHHWRSEPKSRLEGSGGLGAGDVDVVGEGDEARRRIGRTLSDRGLARLLYEIDKREGRYEWVFDKGLDNAEHEGGSGEPRPLRDDWLDRFFRYVADVDEKEILEVLAKALSEAATRDKPLMSPRALDALRYFQPDSYRIFVNCSTLLTMLGNLPLGFFDNEDQDMGALALELLQEAGLVKVETAQYYVLPLGDFICTFSYQHDERFNFEIVKLTQVGREIAGLIKNELRRVPDALKSSGKPGGLLTHQLQGGLTDAMINQVAQALLRSMSDRWAIETTVIMRTPSGNRKIFESIRLEFKNPFTLKIADKVGNESDRFMDIVAQVFTEFDEYELPVLVDRL